MKKYIKYILIVILMIPVFLCAETYSEAVTKSKEILGREEYVNTYEKYIKKIDASTGGELISLEEYKLSMKKGKTYLFYGLEYWTRTKNSENKAYSIRVETNAEIKADSLTYKEGEYNTRTSVYVKPEVKVRGSGTYNDPWTFNPIYKVNAEVNNSKYGEVVDKSSKYVEAMCSSIGCIRTISFEMKDNYRYLDNDCNGEVITARYENNDYTKITKYENGVGTLVENENEYKEIFRKLNEENGYREKNVGIIRVSNVRRNTTCHIILGTGFYEIEVPGSTPNKIYLRHAENYYKDSDGTEVIKVLERVPDKVGYKYKGYVYKTDSGSSIRIIEGKNILQNTKSTIIEDTKLEAEYEANRYKIKYEYNGGASGGSSPEEALYDEEITITNPVRRGYIFKGWNISNLEANTNEINGEKTNKTSVSGEKSTKYQYLRSDTGEVTFSAVWEAKTVRVTYESNGGSTSTDYIDVKYDGIGCELTTVELNGTTKSVSPLVEIEECSGIVVKNDKTYDLFLTKTKEMISLKVSSMYFIKEGGNSVYYMIFKGQEMNLIENLTKLGYIKSEKEEQNTNTNVETKNNTVVTNKIENMTVELTNTVNNQ